MPFPTEKQLVLKTLETISSVVDLIKKDPEQLKKSIVDAFSAGEEVQQQAIEAQKAIDLAPSVKAEADAVMAESVAHRQKSEELLSDVLRQKKELEEVFSSKKKEIEDSHQFLDKQKLSQDKKDAELLVREQNISSAENSLTQKHAELNTLKTRYENKLNLIEQSKAL